MVCALSTPLVSLSLAATPVVDVDGTIFIQGGIFLALVLILDPLLFKPWLATQARRVEATGGALQRAKELQHEADALAADYDARLAAARDHARELRSAARREEERVQAEHLAAARDEAATSLDQARARAEAESRTARQALEGRIEELADTIATKLLGRTP